MTIAKRLASGTANPGELVVYEITLTNTGNQDAENVVVTDPVPTYTTMSPAESSPGWTCAGSTFNLQHHNREPARRLKPHVSTFAVRIAPTLPAEATELQNTACASDIPARSVCATARNPLGGEASLALEKSYDGGPLAPGKLLVFHLDVTNRGSRPSGAVDLREIVPDHSRFTPASSDSRWSCPALAAGSSCTLILGPIPAGTTVTVDFAVTADEPLPPSVRQIANSACLTLPSGDTIGCSDVSTPLDTFVEATLDDALSTDANGNGKLDNGDVLTYTLTVLNPSPKPATSLTVTVPLDEHLGLIVASVTTSAGTVTGGNGSGDSLARVEIPQLSPGGSVTITLQALATNVSVPGLKSVSTQGSVSGANFETEPTDDPATAEDDDPTVTPLGPAVVVHDVPTLGQLGLLLLAGGLGALGLAHLRRRAPLS